MGYPPPDLGWGTPQSAGWGTPSPSRPKWCTQPHPDLGWRTPPCLDLGWGTPAPPPTSVNRLKILPSIILRMRAVIKCIETIHRRKRSRQARYLPGCNGRKAMYIQAGYCQIWQEYEFRMCNKIFANSNFFLTVIS